MCWQVISIQSTELVLEAFKRMRDNEIGGLPVVEGPNNKIVGNISIRDIRHLLLNPDIFSSFRCVFQPCIEPLYFMFPS